MTEISLLSHAQLNEVIGKTIFKPVYRCVVIPKDVPMNKYARFVKPDSDVVIQSNGNKMWICKSKS